MPLEQRVRIDQRPTLPEVLLSDLIAGSRDQQAINWTAETLLKFITDARVFEQPDGTDFNALLAPGTHFVTTGTNAPVAGAGNRWAVEVILDPTSETLLQRASLLEGGTTLIIGHRRRTGAGVWENWLGGSVRPEDVGWDDPNWFSDMSNMKEVIVAIGEWLYALDRGVGDIYPVTRTTLRDNELKANGALLSRASYPELWAHAQSSGLLVTEANWWSNNQGSFSSGDGSTTFRIPDLRGEFLRGWDDGRGVDSGRVAGTFQGFAIQSHVHPIAGYEGSTGGGTGATVLRQTGGTFNVGSTGGTETRPRNVAYMVVIRFR